MVFLIAHCAPLKQTPSPVAIIGPLKASGTRFVDANGVPVVLLGAVPCCSSAGSDDIDTWHGNGFPIISIAALDTLARYQANYTHIRLGPFYSGLRRDQWYLAYMIDPASAKNNLDTWNADYWNSIRGSLGHAQSLGIYVEIDLIDAWLLERPELSPWSKNNNINGINEGDCSIISRPPGSVQAKFIRKAVAETGKYPNVMYQIGNETFDCGGVLSKSYELGIAAIVRDELAKKGYGARLIGTNSERGSIE